MFTKWQNEANRGQLRHTGKRRTSVEPAVSADRMLTRPVASVVMRRKILPRWRTIIVMLEWIDPVISRVELYGDEMQSHKNASNIFNHRLGLI